jgi:hypothetical protein
MLTYVLLPAVIVITAGVAIPLGLGVASLIVIAGIIVAILLIVATITAVSATIARVVRSARLIMGFIVAAAVAVILAGRDVQPLTGIDIVGVIQVVNLGNTIGVHPKVPADAEQCIPIVDPVILTATPVAAAGGRSREANGDQDQL